MAEPFATVEELKLHWAALSEDQYPEAAQRLSEAAIRIRSHFPTVDSRIAAGTLDPDIPRLVSTEMVKRALTPPAEGMEGVAQASGTTGPFTTQFTYSNPDGALYLSKEDRRMLSPAPRQRRAFTIMPGPARA